MVVVVVLRVRREVRNARFLIDMYVFICTPYVRSMPGICYSGYCCTLLPNMVWRAS